MAKKVEVNARRHHSERPLDTELLDQLEVKLAHALAARVQGVIWELHAELTYGEGGTKAESEYAKKLIETTYIIETLFWVWSDIRRSPFHDLKASVEALQPNNQGVARIAKFNRLTGQLSSSK